VKAVVFDSFLRTFRIILKGLLPFLKGRFKVKGRWFYVRIYKDVLRLRTATRQLCDLLTAALKKAFLFKLSEVIVLTMT